MLILNIRETFCIMKLNIMKLPIMKLQKFEITHYEIKHSWNILHCQFYHIELHLVKKQFLF